jgi:hypothetical protein
MSVNFGNIGPRRGKFSKLSLRHYKQKRYGLPISELLTKYDQFDQKYQSVKFLKKLIFQKCNLKKFSYSKWSADDGIVEFISLLKIVENIKLSGWV